MDGDLQNDPADIATAAREDRRGLRRRQRLAQEAARRRSTRRLPSRIANWLIGRVTGVRLHDYGCTLKAYRREIVLEMQLYGEMHRFIPALAYQAGARITEFRSRHQPRRPGKTKYGLDRTIKVLLDLMTVKFLSGWSTKPSYFFGGFGAILCLLGTAFVTWTAYKKIVNGIYVYRQPSLIVGVFLFTIGIKLILLGLLAELSCGRITSPRRSRCTSFASGTTSKRHRRLVTVARASHVRHRGSSGGRRSTGRARADARGARAPRAGRRRASSRERDGIAVGLGFRRLAIIDLETGNQPIANDDGSLPRRLQRRDLQLPRAARGARRARPPVRDERRHRGHRPPLRGPRRRAASSG